MEGATGTSYIYFFSCLLASFVSVSGTSLDDYVALPDANYSYVQVGSSGFDLSRFTTGYVLELAAGAGRGPASAPLSSSLAEILDFSGLISSIVVRISPVEIAVQLRCSQ